MQYQAGYLLDCIRLVVNENERFKKQDYTFNSLLKWLCTFEIETTLNLERHDKTPGILAVANNIITRGLPTLPDIFIEKYFEKHLGLTKETNDENGSLMFPSIDALNVDKLFRTFHVVEPRATDREKYLNTTDLESCFEVDFLKSIIPETRQVLTQLLQKQRSRKSFTHDNNHGRVDFSLEIPYDQIRETTNIFREPVSIHCHKTYIVEVDGARYHTDLLDNLKDFQLAELGNNNIHIREHKQHTDSKSFLDEIFKDPFITISAYNYNDANYLGSNELLLCLSPVGTARIQKVILSYLMSSAYDKHKQLLRLAVVERDLPCAYAAIDTLNELLCTLQELACSPIILPEISLSVFCSEEFITHPLHGGRSVLPFSSLNAQEHDLVLDISLLRREGIFRENDIKINEKSIRIRNAHYIAFDTASDVISAHPVTYKEIGTFSPDEVFEPFDSNVSLLTKLLQSIFRKEAFRNGQLAILNRALSNRSVIGLLPTGAGKSLIYQLAAILQPGITVVVDPIRSLMLDQYNSLRAIYFDNCAYINSTLSVTQRNYVQQLLIAGRLQLIFVSPERFVIEDFRNILDITGKSGHFFSYAVIDEVHCVSEWGHDFRTPYLNLGTNLQTYCITYNRNKIPLLGLTATASFDVMADIERELNIPDDDGKAVIRYENTIRDEINYQIIEVANQRLNEVSNEMAARDIIGESKQQAVLKIIADKETIFNKFNNHSTLRKVLSDSYKRYVLPDNQRSIDIDDEDKFIEQRLLNLHIDNQPFLRSERDGKYKYGIIVFAPHRSGRLGVLNSVTGIGMFEHGTATNNEEAFSYFIGSSDDENAEIIDKESFAHLTRFKSNDSSVMIATKAFGMGIDKPDVRMTIHLNIPQSIESFVQESGRAGRDGKVAISTILFNNSTTPIQGRSDQPFHLDKDVLLYFHNNSFKGKLKERVMIYELRNNITFPNRTNKQLLTELMNEQFGDESLKFVITKGQGQHHDKVFINLEDNTRIGFLNFITQEVRTYNDLGRDSFSYELLNWLKSKLPFNLLNEEISLSHWLDQTIVSTNTTEGIEKLLSKMALGEERTLHVPFTNLFYSKRVKQRIDFKLNPNHADKWIATPAIKKIINDGRHEENICKALLRDAVYDNLEYTAMIKKLDLTDKVHEASLLDTDHQNAIELQKAYYIPRSQDDTAKAIYRLSSIGIIESYTIDYQNKIYTLTIRKKEDEVYYNSLQQLIARYASSNIAISEIKRLKDDAASAISLGKATVISKCLEYLTDFIYEKIKEKRLQAIDDMVKLCQQMISIDDLEIQNKFIKDEIYYYFNAKYSKRDFIVQSSDGKSINASMPDNYDDGLSTNNFIERYIDLVEDETNGQFINNIKHLRGSCMKMLRSYPGTPEFKILKAFSLFILGRVISELYDEAKNELVRGLLIWNESVHKSVHKSIPAGEFLSSFKVRLMKHMDTHIVESLFKEIEDLYYAEYYANYIRDFNTKFLIQ